MIPEDIDAPLVGDNDGDEASSDSSGSSSSSFSSSSQEAVKPKLAPELQADEVTGALHRSMWHVALTADNFRAEIIRTACGRRFPRASISVMSDLHLERGQSLCSHLGCRKGWKAVGTLYDPFWVCFRLRAGVSSPKYHLAELRNLLFHYPLFRLVLVLAFTSAGFMGFFS